MIGSTQDVMLRKALQDVDLNVKENGGTVELYAAAPADTASLFVQESGLMLLLLKNHGDMY